MILLNMKEKIHYAIEAALAVAIIILFVLNFSGSDKTSNTNKAVPEIENVSDIMPIAYVDIDSLMSTYTYMLELNERITRQFENSQAKLTEEARKLQNDLNDFQRKLDTGSFLNQQRAEDEQQRILKKRDAYQQLEARLAQELDEQRFRLQDELRKTIIKQVAEYNKDKGFQVIYGKANDNILFANEVYNITTEVIEYLNLKYAEAPVFNPNE